jgi:hypothetical protein
MKRPLYEVQKHHANVLLEALNTGRAALDGSATGCGKTLVAAEIATTAQCPTLVVCPKSAIPMWKKELEVRGVNMLGAINYEMLRMGNTEWGTWVGPPGGIWQWSPRLSSDTMIVWDEEQRCQGMNSQNARMCWSAKRFYNLCLSATAAKDAREMKALGYLLGLHDLRGFWNWTKLYGCQNGLWGGLDFVGGPEDVARLHRNIFPKHGSRLTTWDLRDHFTETQIITTPLEFGDEVKGLYSRMAVELAALKKRAAGDSNDAEALTIRLRARQRVELLKVPVMLELIEDWLKEGCAIPVFVNFTDTLEALHKRLSNVHAVGIVSGKCIKDRQKHIDDFQADRTPILLCNTQAGGTSISLHDLNGNHPRRALISPSDNEKDILQCLGRVHRAGGKTPTQQHVLFAAGTVEEEVELNCRAKMDNIEIFNEGIS